MEVNKEEIKEGSMFEHPAVERVTQAANFLQSVYILLKSAVLHIL